MAAKLTTFDPAEGLDTDASIEAYMDEAVATEDADYIAHARGVVVRAKGRARSAASLDDEVQ